MRIICPDCDAQYEVPEDVIPDDGRDVQCSNCGATWMFEHPDHPDHPGAARAHADDEDDDSPEAAPAAPLSRRELDPKVAGILRAEAEREAAARATDSPPEPLEVQPDLGLTEGVERPARRDTGAAAVMAGDVGEKPARGLSDTSQPGNMTVADAAAAAGSRRDLLPDIEEINSTLRSSGDRDVAGDDLDPEPPGRLHRRRGFRRGLLVAVLIFVIALLAYQFAPEIAEAVPQVDPWLSRYVTSVDEIRASLDARVRDVLSWLDEQAAASGE